MAIKRNPNNNLWCLLVHLDGESIIIAESDDRQYLVNAARSMGLDVRGSR